MTSLPKGTKAMIFAAGLGTRLKPFTDKHPKALALVNGKTLLQRNIEYLKQFGIQDIVINTHHFPDQIKTFLEEHHQFDCNISLSHEVNEALETGGGLIHAAHFLKSDQPIILMNADILTDLDLLRMYINHLHHGGLATLAVTQRDSSRQWLYDDSGILCGWINNQSGEVRYARTAQELRKGSFSGVHIIDPSLPNLINQRGKFSIVDVYLSLGATHKIYMYDHTGDVVIDVGKPGSIEKAAQYFL